MGYNQNEHYQKPLPSQEKSLNNISWHQKQMSAALADISNGLREIVSILRQMKGGNGGNNGNDLPF